MIDKLEKFLPFDWDLVRMPVIGAGVVTGLAVYQSIISALVGTLTVIYIIMKIRRLRSGKDQ